MGSNVSKLVTSVALGTVPPCSVKDKPRVVVSALDARESGEVLTEVSSRPFVNLSRSSEDEACPLPPLCLLTAALRNEDWAADDEGASIWEGVGKVVKGSDESNRLSTDVDRSAGRVEATEMSLKMKKEE